MSKRKNTRGLSDKESKTYTDYVGNADKLNENPPLSQKSTDVDEAIGNSRLYDIYAEIEAFLDDHDLDLDSFLPMGSENLSPDQLRQVLLYYALKKLSKKKRYENIVRMVIQSVHKSIDPQEVIENAVYAMNKYIGSAGNVSIYMVEGNEAVLKSYIGYPDHIMVKLARIHYGRGFTWKTIIEGQPMHCPDTSSDTNMGQLGRTLGIKSYVSMPIRYAGESIGCINVSSQIHNAFDEDELDLLEIVANQIEIAINNARQAEALRKSQMALRENVSSLTMSNMYEKVVNSVIDRIHKSLDLDQVCENAVDALVDNMDQVNNAIIFMVDENILDKHGNPHAVMKANRGHSKTYLKRVESIPYPKGATWKTILDAKTRYVADVEQDSIIGKAGKEFGINSYVSLPFKVGDETVGCIHIHSLKNNAFSQDDLKLFEVVNEHLETAINNAVKAEALKLSEESARAANNQLEDGIRERTTELQKTNTLLIKEILERKYVEKQLKDSLNEKDVLLKEIHHRVKNNLQIIMSLLKLQSKQITDEAVLALFNESKDRIVSIAALHEQLYSSKDLTSIDFTSYPRNMANYLSGTYGLGDRSVHIKIDSGSTYLNINSAVPLGLIVNELASNAIKHGFPSGVDGYINIEFKKSGDKYCLSVSNNGLELPKDLKINNSPSLGLELVSSLAKQLKGTLSVNSGKVTRFQIEFSA